MQNVAAHILANTQTTAFSNDEESDCRCREDWKMEERVTKLIVRLIRDENRCEGGEQSGCNYQSRCSMCYLLE